MKNRLFTLCALLALGIACAPASEPAPEPASEPSGMDEQAAVDAVRATYVEQYNLGNADRVADLFTDDAVTLFADGGVHVGRADIQAAHAAEIAANPTAQIVADETVVGADVAVQRGTYSVEMTPEGMDAVHSSGYYISALRKVDGDWKIAAVISNYDSEPPAGVPAGPRPEEPPAEMTDTPLNGLVSAYVEHFNAGDADALAGLYAEDAFASFANRPAAEGRDAIRAALQERLAAGAGQLTLHLVADTDMGDGQRVGGGWYETTPAAEGMAPQRGNWIAYVVTGADGSLQLQWLVTNVVPGTM